MVHKTAVLKEKSVRKPEVVFEPKQYWQKNDCINRATNAKCTRPSTLQAVVAKGNVIAAIRCCDDPRCKEIARQLALANVGHKT